MSRPPVLASALRLLPALAAAAAMLPAGASPAGAQAFGNPDAARVQAGPLSVAPLIRLTNVGYDSNVFGESDGQNPDSDITATLSPIVEAWLRLPHARVSARTELDFVYFRELDRLRSLDTDNAVRVELLLSRFRPYVAGMFSSTRHRFSFEIDEPIRFRQQFLTAGSVVRLTGKTSLDLSARRQTVDYENDAVYLDSQLSRLLDRTASGERATLWYEATPLTSVGLDLQWQRDRFDFAGDRDSKRFRIAPIVEFQPNAVISGRAQFGIHRREFVNRDLPTAKGSFLLVDLRYTLLGSTQFGLQAQRDVAYSYRLQEEEYQLTGFTASVAQRLGDDWDVRGRIGHHRLAYLLAPVVGGGTPDSPVETLRSYGGEVTYRLGRTRVGFHVSYRERHSDISALREHDRFWVASSLTYAFD